MLMMVAQICTSSVSRVPPPEDVPVLLVWSVLCPLKRVGWLHMIQDESLPLPGRRVFMNNVLGFCLPWVRRAAYRTYHT